jgi:catechol 2,3-dioxygenase-like lactoylglutathione lyase family enzyme
MMPSAAQSTTRGLGVLAIQHVTLWVSDVSRSREFYSGVLALTEIPRPDWFDFQGTWYAVGRQQIHLTRADPLPPRTGEHFCLQVQDLDFARNYLESRGVKCLPDRDYAGTRRFVIFDPDNNYIEIAQIDQPWPSHWPDPLPPGMRGPLVN